MLTPSEKLLLTVVSAQHQWKIRLYCCWPRIAGGLSDKVKIARIDYQTLWLGVRHPAFAQDLLMVLTPLKTKINQFLGAALIKDIRFTSSASHLFDGSEPDHQGVQDKQLSLLSTSGANEHVTLDSVEEEALDKSIDCAELKGYLERFYLNSKKRAQCEKTTNGDTGGTKFLY